MAMTVGRLARRFGLSRSTLLYSDRLGLLRPSGRSSGDYRLYAEADMARRRRDVERLAPEQHQAFMEAIGIPAGDVDAIREYSRREGGEG